MRVTQTSQCGLGVLMQAMTVVNMEESDPGSGALVSKMSGSVKVCSVLWLTVCPNVS